MAFGISDYHSDGSNIEDQSYGNLQVMRTTRKEDNTLRYETVKTGQCSEEAIKEGFPAVNEATQKAIDKNIGKLKCLESDELIPVTG